MKKLFFYCLLFVFTGQSAIAGDTPDTAYNRLTTDSQRIQYLINVINAVLTDSPAKGDSLANVVIQIAENSRNRALICEAYHDLAWQYINYSEYRGNLATGEGYAQRALTLAKSAGLDNYIIAGYLMQARVARVKTQHQKALEYNNLALSLAVNYGNDSITSMCYSSLANTWLSLNNKLSGFQNRLAAREFAEKSGSPYRILSTTMDLASFYASIGETEKAKDFFYKVMQFARENRAWESVMIAQRNLADIYLTNGQRELGMSFYNKAMALADSVNRSGYKINIYFDLLNYFLDHETAESAMKYFDSQPEITRFLLASGEAFNVDKIKGLYYSEKKQYDSADFYFARVLKSVAGSMNNVSNFSFYKYLAHMYAQRGDDRQQLNYLQKSLAVAETTGDIQMKKDIALDLDSFYQRQANYKEAFAWNSRFITYSDSLRKLSEQKDLLTLEIDNENKRKMKQEEEALLAKEKRNNIQYLGISAAIATVFILLVLVGAFKISIPVIKALGFFAFIFLFEFIILLADNQIHEWTHGEPWKVMSLKIVLVAMLFPLHHWLEHRVIHYLLTHDMLPKKAFRFASRRKKLETLVEEEEI